MGEPNKGILLLPWLIDDTAVIEKLSGVLLFFWLLLLLCLSLKLWPVSVIRWLMHYTDTGGWPLSQVTHVCSGALHWANWGPGLSSCETWWPSVHSGLCTGNTHMYTRGLHYNLYFTTTRRAHRIKEIKFMLDIDSLLLYICIFWGHNERSVICLAEYSVWPILASDRLLCLTIFRATQTRGLCKQFWMPDRLVCVRHSKCQTD